MLKCACVCVYRTKGQICCGQILTAIFIQLLEDRSNDLTNTLKGLDIVLGLVELAFQIAKTHAHYFRTKEYRSMTSGKSSRMRKRRAVPNVPQEK